MAKKPSKTTGSKVSNIMGLLRGNFDFNSSSDTVAPQAFGSPEIISHKTRSKILQKLVDVDRTPQRERIDDAGVMGIVQSSLSKVGNERLENRKILQLMPEVDKAARLMIASTFSPNDLSRQHIPVVFDISEIPDAQRKRLNDHATDFFQKKLNLKTSAPAWVYQFGYETGAAIFAIVPLRAIERITDDSFLGLENFIQNVVEPIAHANIFGFGDSTTATELNGDVTALESFAHTTLIASAESPTSSEVNAIQQTHISALVANMIGKEALNLTDNPEILHLNDQAKKRSEERTTKTLAQTYRNRPKAQTIITVPSDKLENDKTPVSGEPILFRLPPESVTVIHTPGDPNDHQGYLVLLDQMGNPISALTMENDLSNAHNGALSQQNSLFNQVYNAYGMNNGQRGLSKEATMNRLYNQVVTQHLKKRVGKAGFTNVTISNSDSILRCMFTRFLQQKQTRVLFLPKELVTYMSFELDQNGYGVSRLDRIKFNLGMKMAVQISRVLASIKAAMDRRKIEIKFTDNLIEQPETIFQNVIKAYLDKSKMSFSVDPNVIQNQIADKSVSIKGIDIPGMEQFDLTNEPDQRSGSVDFDPDILQYLDKQILNGLKIPAATMNSLNEDDYARSVTTTNLFFSMDVSIDQDIVIRCVSDLIRKFARYSQGFINGIYDIIPSLKAGENDDKSIKVNENDQGVRLPPHYTIDKLIDEMAITLPHPNVAPSKAQFEALTAMIESISSTIDSLFSDDLIGKDDTLMPVVRLLRARFKAVNIRTYLDSSGMASINIPDSDFSPFLTEIGTLQQALQNVSALLDDKKAVVTPPEPDTPIEGY